MTALVLDWIERAGGRSRVATELGITVGAVGHWCTGLRRPPLHHLLALSKLANANHEEWARAVALLARREAA